MLLVCHETALGLNVGYRRAADAASQSLSGSSWPVADRRPVPKPGVRKLYTTFRVAAPAMSAYGRVLPFAGLRLTVRFRGKPAARLPGRGSPVSITTTFTEHIRGFWRRDPAVHFQNYLMARV